MWALISCKAYYVQSAEATATIDATGCASRYVTVQYVQGGATFLVLRQFVVLEFPFHPALAIPDTSTKISKVS